jgi:tetratricopeptide (TPR) repeat protein
MIVKNESKIIERLLLSVLPLIDSYCICDTGSTDNTIEIIKTFFQDKCSGKIVEEPFQDFAYNRTYALRACNGMQNADYILLVDADMVLTINENINMETFKESLTLDSYCLYQGNDSFFYSNMRIIKNDPEYRYWGVTHEYCQLPGDATKGTIEKNILFIHDIGDGGSKENKFIRDVELLKKGLIEHPNNDRYLFYLANSYRDLGQYQNAIETYKKRIEVGGWNQEVWHSYYSIGNCYKHLGDVANMIYYMMEAYGYFNERIENLYEIVKYYRIAAKPNLAYIFYEIAESHRGAAINQEQLFLENDVYEYLLDYEYSIFGFYLKDTAYNINTKCMSVLSNKNADDSVLRNVLSNYKFYAKPLNKFDIFKNNPLKLALDQVGNSVKIDLVVFNKSTPSIIFDNVNNMFIICQRYVNYKIDENGNYTNQEKIISKNVISIIDAKINSPTTNLIITEFELLHNPIYDDVYVGIEDIRLFLRNNVLEYNGNRCTQNGNMRVEHGTIDLKSKFTRSEILITDNIVEIEKNWVIFNDFKNDKKMVYNWHPLKIGHIEDSRDLKITHEINTPNFFNYLRGSTNGIKIGAEIWFICHLVSYEECRYYYHIVVVLDSETYELKRYTELFTFGNKPVEYTLGFVYLEQADAFTIGYSEYDRVTKYIMVPKSKLDELFY